MKKIISFLLIISFVSVISAQNKPLKPEEALKKADELIQQKKYLSAFNTLNEQDPDNQNPRLALKKEDIVLDYFLVSFQHQLFGLKDLEPGETVEQLRGRNGDYTLVRFPVDSVLLDLAAKHPRNADLYKGLGRYYMDYYFRYRSMVENAEKFLDMAETYFRKALEINPRDAETHKALGELYHARGQYDKAAEAFRKAVKIKPSDATAHYNLAYMLARMQQYDEAVREALAAAKLYQKPEMKADAYGLAGIAYLEQKQWKKAIPYLEKAYKIDPENYDVLYGLTYAYLQTGNRKHLKTAKALFDLDPLNTYTYSKLATLYESTGHLDELKQLFKDRMRRYQANDSVAANLHFYLGQLYLRESDTAKAREQFLLAKEAYKNFLPEGHEVFGIIDDRLKGLKEE